MAATEHPFEVVWEIEPPTRADTDSLHGQLAAAADAATAILVPDNHTGRATVSSIAVARAVNATGHRAIACVNARDRNLLGFQRDLLTCTFDGVDELLFVYGDNPDVGTRATDLTVRRMLDEARRRAPQISVGVTTRLRPLPAWKATADRLFVQVSYDLDALLRWRDEIAFDGPVHPAVMVVPSRAMAERLAAKIPGLRVPDAWLDAIDGDPNAGVELAAALAERIRDSGAFEGVHVVSGRRHRSTAARLADLARTSRPRAAVPV